MGEASAGVGATEAVEQDLRVGIVHDYLTQRGGAERVVLAMQAAFPSARILTSVFDPAGTFPQFGGMHVETSPLQRVGAFRRDPRRALPLLAPTFGRLRVSDVDVVLCSSAGWAHAVPTDAPKLVYCHNPPRWIYQHQDYLAPHRLPARLAFGGYRRYLRRWDRRAASSATRYLANSSVVRERIKNAYGRDARVLPPPVMIDADADQQRPGGIEPGFFLIVGRSRGYKNVEVACQAFAAMPNQRLVVVGGLPEGTWPAHLSGVRDIPDAQLRWLYANCRAVVATAHEDFGLTPIEGNTFGRPALVLRAGGFLDTLVEGVTGLYIEELTVDAVRETVQEALTRDFDEGAIRAHAERYSLDSFISSLRAEVQDVISSRQPRPS